MKNGDFPRVMLVYQRVDPKIRHMKLHDEGLKPGTSGRSRNCHGVFAQFQLETIGYSKFRDSLRLRKNHCHFWSELWNLK